MRTLELRFLLVLALSMVVFLPVVNAQPRIASVQSIYIADAYYADLDNDGYEDDIKLLLEFCFENVDSVRVDLNIWIELPSGLMYAFRISVYRAPAQSTLNVDCLDMATESGWYTVTMIASIMGMGGGKYYITDQLDFDPPTGGGPGLPPAIDAYF
jgi:hypothetical protein